MTIHALEAQTIVYGSLTLVDHEHLSSLQKRPQGGQNPFMHYTYSKEEKEKTNY